MMNVMCGIKSYFALSGLVGFVESLTRPAIRDVNIFSPFRASLRLTDTHLSHKVAKCINAGYSPVKPRSGVINNHNKNYKS